LHKTPLRRAFTLARRRLRWQKPLAKGGSAMSNPNVANTTHQAAAVPPPVPSETQLAEAWFDAPPPSTRRPSAPPPPVVEVGEFLGDPVADAWLR
jgi:hypothetical protein